MRSGTADPQSEGDLALDLISTLQSQLLSLRNRVQVRLRIHTSYIFFPFLGLVFGCRENAGESRLKLRMLV